MSLEFEILEGGVVNLSKQKPTIAYLRIYGNVDGEDIDYETTLVSPKEINTYNKLSEHITEFVLNPKIERIERKHLTEAMRGG